MNYSILYNPLSRNGKNINIVNKLKKKLMKKNHHVSCFDLTLINDVNKFINDEIDPDTKVIIVGGDGTLNRIANRLYDLDIKREIFLSQAGTGNDFARSMKNRKKLIPVNGYLKNLPEVVFNDERTRFLNGAGLGLDGLVCHLINSSREKKNKLNYFKNAFKAFRIFKPLSATVTIDGNTFTSNKVWLTAVMNAPYFGGGMKIAPKAKRDSSNLTLVMVKRIPKWLLILIFPTIYLGIHTIFTRWVKFYQGNDIKISFDQPCYLQIDGDSYQSVETITIRK